MCPNLLLRLTELMLKLMGVQRLLVVGSVMMSYRTWLPQQHRIINMEEGGVVTKEGGAEEEEGKCDIFILK